MDAKEGGGALSDKKRNRIIELVGRESKVKAGHHPHHKKEISNITKKSVDHNYDQSLLDPSLMMNLRNSPTPQLDKRGLNRSNGGDAPDIDEEEENDEEVDDELSKYTDEQEDDRLKREAEAEFKSQE